MCKVLEGFLLLTSRSNTWRNALFLLFFYSLLQLLSHTAPKSIRKPKNVEIFQQFIHCILSSLFISIIFFTTYWSRVISLDAFDEWGSGTTRPRDKRIQGIGLQNWKPSDNPCWKYEKSCYYQKSINNTWRAACFPCFFLTISLSYPLLQLQSLYENLRQQMSLKLNVDYSERVNRLWLAEKAKCFGHAYQKTNMRISRSRRKNLAWNRYCIFGGLTFSRGQSISVQEYARWYHRYRHLKKRLMILWSITQDSICILCYKSRCYSAHVNH